jgi:hypothetical protein
MVLQDNFLHAYRLPILVCISPVSLLLMNFVLLRRGGMSNCLSWLIE